jgi:uncharacterized protein YijF (DUF1287 family)
MPAPTRRVLPGLLLGCAALAGCAVPAPPPDPRVAALLPQTPAVPAMPAPSWVAAARAQVGVTVRYDSAYTVLGYPGGDVPADRGVCTDVVIRALRRSGLDLQQAVHEDMRAHFDAYPRHWGLRAPDRNIDHRRVPNLQRWFERQHWQQAVGLDARGYRPGDLVTWTVQGRLPHIGIVSDRVGVDGTPLVLHNIGAGTREENVLFAYPITGHYRPPLPGTMSASSSSSNRSRK